MTQKKLTPKQARFVEEYLIDLNATQAAIRSGYSKKTARQIGEQNLSKLDIATEISAAQQKRSARTEITQDRVLQELARIAFFDIRKLYNSDGSMKAPHDLDDDAAAVLSGVDVVEEFSGRGEDREQIGVTKKAKVFDKGSALTLAMRHLGMLNDKIDLTSKGDKVTSGVLVVPGVATEADWEKDNNPA